MKGSRGGPFHVLLAHRGRETSWLLAEASIVFAGLAVWLTLALVSLDPLRAPAFLFASLAGAGVASLVLALGERRTEVRVGIEAKQSGYSERRSLSGPLLIARLQWRRRVGPFPASIGAVGLAITGGFATALAIRNNPDPNVGSGVLGVAGLVGGIILASLDLSLLRFAGREPRSLLNLIMNFALASPVVVMICVLIIGALAGVSITTALAIALGVGMVIFAYSTTLVLHALGEASRFSSFTAGVELTIVLIIMAVFAPLAFVWTIARGVMLARAARRLRWRDF